MQVMGIDERLNDLHSGKRVKVNDSGGGDRKVSYSD